MEDQHFIQCPHCLGTKLFKGKKCQFCQGEGKISEEYYKLIAPLDVPTIKDNVKEFFLRRGHSILLSIVFLLLGIGLSTYYVTRANDKPETQLSLVNKMGELRQSYNYFTRAASKEELLMSWVKKFSGKTYELGGDPRRGVLDCTGGLQTFLYDWGSAVNYQNVRSVVAKCEFLIKEGEVEIRKKKEDVKTTDLIIIQLEPGKPEHVGVVYDVTNGWVRYMDVNAGTMTWGFEREKWGSSRIYAIYSLSFSFWAGDIMKKMSEAR